MLKIRYNIATTLLTGWEDDPDKFDELLPREGEFIVLMSVLKPIPTEDYEYWYYDGVSLVRSDKPIFTSHSFEPCNPAMGLIKRIKCIEEFLKEVYP